MTPPIRRARPDDQARRHMFAKVDSAPHAAPSPCGCDIIHTDNPQLSHISPACVEKLTARLRAQTAECVMETFGISVKT